MACQTAPDAFAQLPHEVLCMIVDHLNSASLNALIQTCRYQFESFHATLYRNSIDRKGFSPSLLYAVLTGAPTTAQHALDAGVNPGIVYTSLQINRSWKRLLKDQRQLLCRLQTPLIIATTLGYREVVDVLLQKSESYMPGVSLVELGGCSPAYYTMLQAVRYGRLTILKDLIRLPVFNLDETDEGGTNLLNAICCPFDGIREMDNKDIVEFLLENLTEPDRVGAQDQTALDAAVITGLIPTVRLLVDSGKFKLNRQNVRGRTAFYLAVEFGNEECITLLLNRPDIDPNIPDRDGHSPIVQALQHNRTAVAELLMASAKVQFQAAELFAIACMNRQDKIARRLLSSSEISKAPDETGKTWLHIAAEKNSPTGMTDLLKRKDMPLNARCADGMTAIAYSVSTRSVAATNRLLKNKPPADVTIANNMGWTPLHFACRETQAPPLIEKLLSCSASVNAATVDGLTPLHVACEKGSLKVVQVLLEAGADAVAEAKDGRTPLHVACAFRFEQIVNLLCKYVPKNHRSLRQGRTPLHVACEVGHTEISKHLLQLGADACLRDPTTGKTPLTTACKGGYPIIVDELIKRKANPNEIDDSGLSLLHKSCTRSHPMTATKLIKRGADLHAKTPDGLSPLHLACMVGAPMILRSMLKHGADVNVIGPDGLTPLLVAAGPVQAEYPEMNIEILVKAGAELEVVGPDGKRPLQLASEEGRVAKIKALVLAGADPLATVQDKPCQRNTPLQAMCYFTAFPETFEEMLEHCKRPVKEAFPSGWSALHDAAAACNSHAVKLLLEHGLEPQALTEVEVVKLLIKYNANVNHKADTGRTVLWEAICNNADQEVQQVLRNHGAIS
ncbi:hypothetical protein VHEMI08857 [[Torrubiella] hemipterigena]|uniref:F-box domain-containing protein n=1 Tax=[Torrubiella] hemipterigena TaxID=1531966 RepID=A0A0A1T837_9HYPO|nr:hypothetical protein VHEMI08857 [[Torrubiella] hemipterigena]